MKKIIDKVLRKFGLVRYSAHQAALEGNDNFMRKLGEAAKKAGVTVCLDDDRLEGLTLDSDVFILGQRNVLRDCDVQGTINVAPRCTHNVLIGIRILPKHGESK